MNEASEGGDPVDGRALPVEEQWPPDIPGLPPASGGVAGLPLYGSTQSGIFINDISFQEPSLPFRIKILGNIKGDKPQPSISGIVTLADGLHASDILFDNCVLIFAGVAPFSLNNCVLKSSRFEFAGYAAETLMALSYLQSLNPSIAGGLLAAATAGQLHLQGAPPQPSTGPGHPVEGKDNPGEQGRPNK